VTAASGDHVVAEESGRRAYWDDYYAHSRSGTRPLPSQFATFVAGELAVPHRVVDFGCGNGRDSLFFASYGHQVVGIDGSAAAVAYCSDLASSWGQKIEFLNIAVEDPELPSLVPAADGPTVVYARFFLHAITEAEESAFLAHAATLTRPGDLLAVEYRTVRDLSHAMVTGAHYRRFMEPTQFLLAAASHGFAVAYEVEGFGFAKYQQDDAYVARSILTRR
jgi:SAM-dependent methyltransferase